MRLQLSIEVLHQWRVEQTPHQLIDIREPYEIEICTIGGISIPMAQILENLSSLSQSVPVVIHCNSGKRSDAVCYALRQKLNRTDIYSLNGGIQAFTAAYLPEQSCAQ